MSSTQMYGSNPGTLDGFRPVTNAPLIAPLASSKLGLWVSRCWMFQPNARS